MYRGQVTAVDAKGVYVLVPSLHPTAAFGPLDHVGARPAVGARVLVADCGDESTPDLVVMTGGLPATSTDNAVPRFDGTGGALQGSGVTIDDNGAMIVEKSLGLLWSGSGFAQFVNIAGDAENVRLENYNHEARLLELSAIRLGSGGPHMMAGTGAPSHSPPNGSLYLRTDGTASTTLYVRAAGAWSALS